MAVEKRIDGVVVEAVNARKGSEGAAGKMVEDDEVDVEREG